MGFTSRPTKEGDEEAPDFSPLIIPEPEPAKEPEPVLVPA
jgi:hypothetical protein